MNVDGWEFDGGCDLIGGRPGERGFRDVGVKCEVPGFETVERRFDLPDPRGVDLELVAILAPKGEPAGVGSATRR